MTTDVAMLETERLILRPLAQADVPAVQKYFPHWDIVKYLVKVVPWPYPEDGAQQYLNTFLPKVAAGTDFIWGIRLKEHLHDPARDELIGIVHVHMDGADDSRGFWLALPFQGKGYMTEAVAAVNDHAFNVLGITRFVIKTARGNTGSSRVKEKTGGVLLRVEPVNGHYHGDFTEQEVWELTADNWRATGAGRPA